MKITLLGAAASAAILPVCAQAQAKPPLTAAAAAKAFGARPLIGDISLSPDGSKVAVVAPYQDRGWQIMIADPQQGGAPRSISASASGDEHLRGCSWITDARLICEVTSTQRLGAQLVRFSRLLALNSDGTDVKLVTPKGSSRALGISQSGGAVIDWLSGDGQIMMTRDVVPEKTIGTLVATKVGGLTAERVDTVTLQRHTVEPARDKTGLYLTDGHGTIRVMGSQSYAGTGYMSATASYFYRKPASSAWEPLSKVEINASGLDKGFTPVAVDRDADVAYGFDVQDGREALFRIALDGSAKRELVLARPDVDVDDLVRVGRQRRVVGASYATEVRRVEYFDPAMKQLQASLARALPKTPLIDFVDASNGEARLLVHTGSDVDPGRYYVFDKASRHLDEVLPDRPDLAGTTLATVRPVTFPAADGTPIPAYLTLPPGSDGKNLPAIVMPHGGPAARDEWGFDWWPQFFASRGFAVLQPNFRGSAGYGSSWFQKNGFQSWRTAVGDVDDAGRWLVAQGIARTDRLAVVGWSYGGYAALQGAVLDPKLFRAVIAVAPVTDLELLRTEAQQYVNYPIVDAMIGHGPHVVQGSPARNAATIAAPVLMFHGELDDTVDIDQSRLMANRLRDAGKQVEFVEFKGLDHQLDDSASRAQMLEKSDAFLRAAMGM